uniref:Zinc finger and BTB domain-containing protein 24 n=1 Tax=Lygus hesperus TaxID=30085 RepID=A0A0A9Z6Z6_LYGHE
MWRGCSCDGSVDFLPSVIESVAEVDSEDVELRVVTVTTPLVDGLRELKFQCTMCKLRFSTRVNMERHRKCHNPDYNGPGVPKFKCLVCEQIYNRWAFCQAHLWLVHKIDMDLHTCLICDYKTVHRFQYLIHQKRHQQLKEFACRYCAKQFSQKTQLRNHEVLHMKKNADANLPDWAKPKECDLCHKTFCDSKALKKHVKTVHSKLKPYVCQVCGHCSARKGMFQLHIRQHTGDKPFSCSACDFTTRDHNCLRRHTMRHTGVRQYQCKFCSYSAIQAQLFKQHLIKNHGGDGVFLCNICSFSTLNEQAFIYHHHDDDQKPEIDKLEDKPTVIYVPFNEKDKSSKKGSGELIAINLPDDEESNNFFDHEAAIDTGGITIVEDVEEDKNYSSDPPQSVTTSLNTRGEESAMEGMEVSTQGESAILESKEVSDNDGPLRDNVKDVPTTKWGIPENVDDSTLF